MVILFCTYIYKTCTSEVFLKASRHRAGIMGIERTIQQTHANTDKNISQAFQDLTKLMEKVCITVHLFQCLLCYVYIF